MKAIHELKYLLLISWFATGLAHAGTYLEISTGLIFVDTPADIARPVLGDLRLGYTQSEHQFELALMTSLQDDSINQLSVEVPSIVSALYHYVPETISTLKFHFILGASWVDIESSYPGIANASDDFYGVSYGIGFEEHFTSNRQLKVTVDLMQLYRGDALDIYVTSLGVHYEF